MKSDLDICMQSILNINYHVLPSQALKLWFWWEKCCYGMSDRVSWDTSSIFPAQVLSLFLNPILPSQKFFLPMPVQKHS